MAKKERKEECECEGSCGCKKSCRHGACSGGIYGLGFIGAAIYYISQSTGFWMGVLGILKALVWPAFLVYEFLKFISLN